MHLCFRRKTRENFKTRRRWLLGIVYVVCFLVGAENAMVYPTAWKYLQDLGIHDENVLGLIFSAFNIGALISGVSLGILADKVRSNRPLVLGVNVAAIVGQVMYFVGGDKWILIVGRFIAGLGAGIASIVLAEVSKGTRVSERARVMALVVAIRQLGLVFGPAYNLFTSDIHLDLGFAVVTESNFPGFAMAIVWLVYELLFFLVFFDAGAEMKAIIEEEATQAKLNANQSESQASENGNNNCADEEKSVLLGHQASQYGSIGDDDQSRPLAVRSDHPEREPLLPPVISVCPDAPKQTFVDRQTSLSLARKYVNAFLTDTIVPLMYVQFLAFFVQNAVETSIPPMTQYYWGYGPKENSYIYLLMGILATVVCTSFYILVHFISERLMLLVSSALMVVGCAFNLAVTSQLEKGRFDQFPLFMVGSSIVFIAFTMASTATIAIFSKALPRDVQGFAQGVRQVCSYLGLILGPLYAGGLVYRGELLYLPPLLMSVISLLLVLVSYSKYKIFLEK